MYVTFRELIKQSGTYLCKLILRERRKDIDKSIDTQISQLAIYKDLILHIQKCAV
jgi:hypothetical protein